MTKKNEVLICPIEFEEDIDINKTFSCKKLDDILNNCFHKAEDLIINNFTYNDPKDFRKDLLNILLTMKDKHFVIRDIEKNYQSKKESNILYAIPLVRTQIESVYVIAWIRRNFFEAMALFVISAWKQFYQKSFFNTEETKKISRAYNEKEKLNELKKFIFSMKKHYINDSKIESDMLNIEKNVLEGKINKFEKFPPPKEIIKKVIEISNNDSIVIVLKRLYIDYCWLSSYTHGSPMSGYNRYLIKENFRNLDLLSQRDKLLRNQIVVPNLILDYLSILIVLTDICSLIKNATELIVCLSEFWNEFEDFSLLGKFVWKRWAQSTLGIVEFKN